MKVAFIINARLASAGLWKKRIENSIEDYHLPCSVQLTKGPGDAFTLVESSIKNGFNVLVAVGGDGTFNEVVNGILNSNKRNEILFAGIAAGKANDFSKTLKMPQNIADLFSALSKPKIISIDVGKATFVTHAGNVAKRYFVNAANVGYAAEIVERVNDSSKLLGSTFAYFRAISFVLLKNKTQDCLVKTDNDNWKGSVFNITISNGKFIGSGLHIAPKASLTDGLFNLILLGKFSYKDFLQYLPSVFKGKILNHPSVRYLNSANVKIEALGKPLGVEMDGEFVGYTNAEFSVEPEVLRVLTV